MTEPHPQALICPLCGLGNACAMASGSATPCWCTQLDSPVPLAPLLPPGLPEHCVCPACAQRLLQQAHSATR